MDQENPALLWTHNTLETAARALAKQERLPWQFRGTLSELRRFKLEVDEAPGTPPPTFDQLAKFATKLDALVGTDISIGHEGALHGAVPYLVGIAALVWHAPLIPLRFVGLVYWEKGNRLLGAYSMADSARADDVRDSCYLGNPKTQNLDLTLNRAFGQGSSTHDGDIYGWGYTQGHVGECARSHTPGGVRESGTGLGTCLYAGVACMVQAEFGLPCIGSAEDSGHYGSRSKSADAWWAKAEKSGLAVEAEGLETDTVTEDEPEIEEGISGTESFSPLDKPRRRGYWYWLSEGISQEEEQYGGNASIFPVWANIEWSADGGTTWSEFAIPGSDFEGLETEDDLAEYLLEEAGIEPTSKVRYRDCSVEWKGILTSGGGYQNVEREVRGSFLPFANLAEHGLVFWVAPGPDEQVTDEALDAIGSSVSKYLPALLEADPGRDPVILEYVRWLIEQAGASEQELSRWEAKHARGGRGAGRLFPEDSPGRPALLSGEPVWVNATLPKLPDVRQLAFAANARRPALKPPSARVQRLYRSLDGLD